jgi:hypothetical protein
LRIISTPRASTFDDADLSFAVISRAPIERIERVKRSLGWTFPWVSSHSNDFNYDFGVSFKREDLAVGRANFNYDTIPRTRVVKLSHVLDLFAWDRKSDGRIHVARPDAEGPTSVRRWSKSGYCGWPGCPYRWAVQLLTRSLSLTSARTLSIPKPGKSSH